MKSQGYRRKASQLILTSNIRMGKCIVSITLAMAWMLVLDELVHFRKLIHNLHFTEIYAVHYPHSLDFIYCMIKSLVLLTLCPAIKLFLGLFKLKVK